MTTHAAGIDTVVLSHAADGPQSYHAVVPSELLDAQGQVLDWLIGFVFDTLSARHLDLRVLPSEPFQVEHDVPNILGRQPSQASITEVCNGTRCHAHHRN